MESSELKKEENLEEKDNIPNSKTKRERKSKTIAKKIKTSEDPDSMSFYVKNLVQEMYDIVALDNKMNKEGNAAMGKINKLDYFCSKLINKKIEDELLDYGALDAIKLWLEPLPDKSLPNIKVRRGMLELLIRIKVSKEHLIESGVGKVIHFYSINPREEVNIKKLAKKLIQKWTKMIIMGNE